MKPTYEDLHASDFNMLGQTLTTIAAFSTGVPTSSTDQTTAFTYDGDGDELTQTAILPAGTPSQTTAYLYGVTTGGGSTIDSNDVPAKTEFPGQPKGGRNPKGVDAAQLTNSTYMQNELQTRTVKRFVLR